MLENDEIISVAKQIINPRIDFPPNILKMNM